MRIGIDIRCLAEGKRTGVEEYSIALLEGLFETNPENEYILFFNAWKKIVPDFSFATKYPNVTLKIFHFPNKLLNLSLWYLRFPKLDKLIGGTDIFFLPNLNFSAFSKETKLLVTAHDLSFEIFPETFSLKRRIWHFFINFRWLARTADKVIAVSESTKNDLIDYYGVPKEKITVIHSGIAKRFHVMSRNDTDLVRVQEKYHLPYKFILSLATFEPRKNILALIAAYDALMRLNHPTLNKYSLVIAGTQGWKYEEIFEAIAHSPFNDKIILSGFIADEDKAALYNLAGIFVYPSFYEGFGFPPLEAMACGVPVIVSHSSSLPEIVGDAGILIDPYQPDEIFQALKQILLDQSFADILRKKSEKRVGEFAWEKTVLETSNLFRSLKKDDNLVSLG
jgi:glycosyltransferase involved in cell wall biosynthesis